MEPGEYRLQQDTSVGLSVTPGEILYTLHAGSLVNIVELQYVHEDNRVRGRLAEGGWISVKDTADGHAFAQRESMVFLPGLYRVLHSTSVGPSAELGEILRTLSQDTLVDIVETRRVQEDLRIRGRLATGGWISIKDVADGHMFAVPEVAEMVAASLALGARPTCEAEAGLGGHPQDGARGDHVQAKTGSDASAEYPQASCQSAEPAPGKLDLLPRECHVFVQSHVDQISEKGYRCQTLGDIAAQVDMKTQTLGDIAAQVDVETPSGTASAETADLVVVKGEPVRPPGDRLAEQAEESFGQYPSPDHALGGTAPYAQRCRMVRVAEPAEQIADAVRHLPANGEPFGARTPEEVHTPTIASDRLDTPPAAVDKRPAAHVSSLQRAATGAGVAAENTVGEPRAVRKLAAQKRPDHAANDVDPFLTADYEPATRTSAHIATKAGVGARADDATQAGQDWRAEQNCVDDIVEKAQILLQQQRQQGHHSSGDKVVRAAQKLYPVAAAGMRPLPQRPFDLQPQEWRCSGPRPSLKKAGAAVPSMPGRAGSESVGASAVAVGGLAGVFRDVVREALCGNVASGGDFGPDEMLLQGPLRKRSRYVRQWRSRWAVLTPRGLCTFQEASDVSGEPTESLGLWSVTAATRSGRELVIHTAERDLALQFDSADEAERWGSRIIRLRDSCAPMRR